MAESAERYEVMCLLCLVLFCFSIALHCIGMGKCILSIIGWGWVVLLCFSSACCRFVCVNTRISSFLFSFLSGVLSGWIFPVPYISYHIRL